MDTRMIGYTVTHKDEPENTGDYFAYNYKDMKMKKAIYANEIKKGDVIDGRKVGSVLVGEYVVSVMFEGETYPNTFAVLDTVMVTR